RADAVVEMATRLMDSGTLPVRGGGRPHLTVTAPLEALMGMPGAAAGGVGWGFPGSGKAGRGVGGRGEIRAMVVDEKGDPLHVGRRYRTAPPKLSRALAVRDKHCVWSGCDRPAQWTQRHYAERRVMPSRPSGGPLVNSPDAIWNASRSA